MENNSLKFKLTNIPLTIIEQIITKLQKQGINAQLCKRINFKKPD